jgi:hypothetical protein
MPDTDTIARQLHRVRRRRNLVELQRALYVLIAIGAAAAALLVVLALATSARLFAVAAWSVSATVLASTALVVWETRRRWLGGGRAAAWIDRRCALGGRLRTLVEVEGRAERGAAFFLPLLVEENVGRLASWRPERVVPRRVPRSALAAALAGVGLLLVAIALAPGLRPRVPQIIYSDQPVAGEEMDAADGVPDRVIVAPAETRDRRRGAAETPVAGADPGADDDSALARLSQALQEQIRRELWGAAWERMREAAARLEERTDERRAARAGRGAPADGDGEPGEPWDEARTPRELGRRSTASGATSGRGFQRRDGGQDGEPEAAADEEGGREPGGDERAAGAGNDTDPEHLFGRASGRGETGSERFELGITAPVRARGGAPKRAAGDAPPTAPDARPELGAGQREDGAVRRMPVPAGYEPIVREVFAHRAPPGDASP